MIRRLTALGLVLLGLASLAGCSSGSGQGSGGQSTTGPTTTNVTCEIPKVGALVFSDGTTLVDVSAPGAQPYRVVATLHVTRTTATLVLQQDANSSGSGGSSNASGNSGGPTVTINIDCGPRNSNNPTTTGT